MLLDPRSKDVSRIMTEWGLSQVGWEINRSIQKIIELKLTKSQNFKIRYLPFMPPYTGIMIDGDVEASVRAPHDGLGFMRIQPSARHVSQHNAPIAQFHKLPNGSAPSIFDMYAADIRKMWTDNARDTPSRRSLFRRG